MTPEQSILQLIKEARKGDRVAFDRLIEQYYDRLKSLIHSRLGEGLRRAVEAEDVLQETSMRAFQAIGEFTWRGEDSFMRWLGGIAENVILNLSKKHRRARPMRLRRSLPAQGISPSKGLRRDERFSRLEASLKGLSEDHRKVIILARIEGLSIKETAQRMQRSESAVKNLLLRALKNLKESFGHTETMSLPKRTLQPDGEDDG